MRLQRAEGATALLLTLLAAALHLCRLESAGPLWRDEAAAYHLATSPTVAEVIAKHESFPPPFFFLLRTWVGAFGGSDAALRTFGLLAGLALLAALWGGLRWAGGTVPLLGLALVAIHPTVVVYGDSLRGYGLGTAALLVAYAAFARLAARPDRRSVLVAGVAAVASAQLLFLNVPLLGALGLAAFAVGLARRNPKLLLAVSGIGAVAALSLLPWAGSILATRSWSVLLHVPLGSREIFRAMAQTAGASIPTLGWVWMVLIGLALIPGGSLLQETDVRLFGLFALPLAILAQWGFLELLRYPPRPWYFLPLLAAVAVGLDLRLAGSPLGRGVRLAAALLAVLLLAGPSWSRAQVRMTNMDRVAQRIASEATPEDLVVLSPWHYGVSYERNRRGTTPWTTAPELADHRIHRFDLVKEAMTRPDALQEVRRAIEGTLRAGHRVWLVGVPQVPPPGTPIPHPPPAPLPRSGWHEAPYARAWALQLGAFLRDHSGAGEPVPVAGSGPVHGYEKVALRVFRGWRP